MLVNIIKMTIARIYYLHLQLKYYSPTAYRICCSATFLLLVVHALPERSATFWVSDPGKKMFWTLWDAGCLSIISISGLFITRFISVKNQLK